MSATMAVKHHSDQKVSLPFDPVLSLVTVILLVFGFVMVASATTEISERLYGNPLFLLSKHSVFLVVSLCVGFLTLMVPIKGWQKIDWLLLVVAFVLLIAVLIPGIGRQVNGSARWISIGFFSIQGSEFAKLFVVVYMAGYLVRRKEELLNQWTGFFKPLALVSLIAILLLLEPDFGAVVVIMASVMGLVFLAGVPMGKYVAVVIISVATVAIAAVLQPYRLARFSAFTDPWEYQFSSGYQLTQALIAFGRGEWFGLGLGNSIQKLFFLPEAHTDFLFSVVAEEFGAIGAILLITMFGCMIARGLYIGKQAQASGNTFAAYLAFGISLSLAFQAIINIGVNLGLLPTKGLTLPFISYGGNSLIVSCMLIAILLRISYEQGLVTASSRDHYG
jgi:cell division protein FtsW